MRVRSKAGLAAAVLSIVLVSAPGSGAQAPQQPGAPTYDELVARAKTGDANVDYLALRNAYAESPHYDPYGSKLGELQSEMFQAYRRGDCSAASSPRPRASWPPTSCTWTRISSPAFVMASSATRQRCGASVGSRVA